MINEEIKAYIDEQLLKDLKEEIRIEFIKYKNSISVRENWCCLNMQTFAAKFWGINKPAHTDFGVAYKLHGIDVIYCPFCGVKL